MSREKLAALLLLILIALSGWNIYKADTLCHNIGEELDAAGKAAAAMDFDKAAGHMDAALTLWLKAESYTHIFIRHSEIDSCTDTLYEATEAIISEDPGSINAGLAKLRYHLESIASMERISLGSVF